MSWRPDFGGLWRDRKFLTFWSAQAVSEFGDRITELALPLIAVTLLDATPSEVGFLTAAVWLPNLVSLFIGSWVDQQRNKRGLMIAAALFRMLVLLSLPAASAPPPRPPPGRPRAPPGPPPPPRRAGGRPPADCGATGSS